jgi:cobalt-zinc-cadmium efflux system outer membrane protein
MKNLKINLKFVIMLCFLFFYVEGNSQKLETFINEALTNNPEIKKFELQYRIATEKVNEVNTLPNTEFGLGYFVSEPETRTGAQRFKLSVKQMMPWFGNITARENYVSSLADAKYEDITIAKRKLMASVSQLYYNLQANIEKQAILYQHIGLLNTYERLALTSVAVGKASVVSVLRLQMRQNELEQLKQVLIQEYLAKQSTLNNFLNRDNAIVISILDTLRPPLKDVKIESKKLLLHPELLKYDKRYQSVAQSEVLNQKERNPMIGFGFDYVNVGKRPNMSFSDNGKDIAMPMISVSIPVFNNKYKSQTKQNDLEQQEIVAQKQERLNVLKTLLENAINKRVSARIKFETQAKNIKQAESAAEILMKSYETGTMDFKDVLDIQELQLKFEMQQTEALENYYLQTTIINYLTQQ